MVTDYNVLHTAAQQWDLAKVDAEYALHMMQTDRDAWLGAWLDAKSRKHILWLTLSDEERAVRS
jgi:hypothetical protein